MLVRVETLAKVLQNKISSSSIPKAERIETAEFLRWLTDDGFIFAGYAYWDIEDNSTISETNTSPFGLFKSDKNLVDNLERQVKEDINKLNESGELISINKINIESPVHRFIKFTHISVCEPGSSGNPSKIHSIVGILTSKGNAQESSSIPLIRQKLKEVLVLENVIENSHDFKAIVDVIDSMPKVEALRLNVNSLREITHSILEIENKNETRVLVKLDPTYRGALVLVAMPRDQYSNDTRDSLQSKIESTFGISPGSCEHQVDLTSKNVMKVFFYAPLPEGDIPPIDIENLQNSLVKLSRNWISNLEERIFSANAILDPKATWRKYEKAFPTEYQALQSDEDCLEDIIQIESLNHQNSITVSFNLKGKEHFEIFTLNVYGFGKRTTITQAFPILEDAGLEVIDGRSSTVYPKGTPTIYIDRFLVRSSLGSCFTASSLKTFLAPGLKESFLGNVENDRLNSLILSASLDTRIIALLRSYASLLWQVNKFATRSVLLNALSHSPEASISLWQMFETKFNPDLKLSLKKRKEKLNKQKTGFFAILQQITDITQDRVLRAIYDLMAHTTRTNYYQNLPAIAHKIHSAKVDIIPRPRPKFEIFIHSPEFEGVHLRTGNIARGGIRWSDRNEDYRSEVLGLVKTQKVKNSVIIPGGAKGGFVLRELPEDYDSLKSAVEDTYKKYIRNLLSITDNRKDGAVIHPDRVIAYDGEDPYFVVAADKGTATFSDIANKIAVEEFDFWLGDAFASGGSNGYDHKLCAITARGTWECVKRHFIDLGIDYINQAFTAVGIGDMSGDVFGNGLLLSKQYKLVGAFNHKHIFLDPDPDPLASFQERKRLFEMPRSQWSDYNPKIISKGGGVYERFAKEISLTPEIRSSLNISDDIPNVINGEQLISHILKARVDLLWNGGIGTYVKSSTESNADVADGTNDQVRIDADELRCRIFAEGGNLGISQLGRIEFANRSGRINTDAIDNSGGVALSDNEVNLKILFSGLIESGKLSLEERNSLLKEIEDEVIEKVLEHNRNHALSLTIAQNRSKINIQYFTSLIGEVSKRGYIDRQIEFLPGDQELSDRAARKEGLCRPELAICLSAVKLWVKEEILNTKLPRDPLLNEYLLQYFPETVRKTWNKEILEHPLSKYLIITQITNELVDSFGITFVHRMCVGHSARPVDVVKCALAAEDILGLAAIKAEVKRFDTFDDNQRYLKLRLKINKALREATAWLLSRHSLSFTLGNLVDHYKNSYQTILEHAENVFHGKDKEEYLSRLNKYEEYGLSEESSKNLALFWRIQQVFEMLWTTKESGKDANIVAKIFTKITDTLDIREIRAAAKQTIPENKWENELLTSAADDARRAISYLTCELIENNLTDDYEIAQAIITSGSYEQYRNAVDEIISKPEGVAAFSIIAKQIRNFTLNLNLDDLDDY